MTFKEWLSKEGITSHGLVNMLPSMGNADWKRCDMHSKYHAQAQNCSPMPPVGVKKKNKPSHPPDVSFMDKDTSGYGFDGEDRNKAQARSVARHLHKGASSGAPLRTPRVYT